MKKTVFNVSALTALLVPAMAFAQNFVYVNTWLNQGIYWLRLSITVIMILMTVFFLYNVLRFIMDKGEKPEDTANKRKTMINGLIGLFISVAVWGIINLAGSITGVDTNQQGVSPNVTCPPGLRYIPQTGVCGN
ncbi:MAG: hypothetical protein JWM92_302 [Candidatus Nomurabacteria bacterium]|jgi:hypothetical protein|nr:hypothetical protein [Candidatus Nomurabacteria bacterium]